MLDNKITITFLGTGTSIGVPVVACKCPVCQSLDSRDKRFRASVLVNVKDVNIVIDCGPDFRSQMLRQNVEDIDAILITHQHRDHIGGLDDVRAFNYVLNKIIDIYASSETIDSIKIEYPYIFRNSGFFAAPQLNINNINIDNPFYIKDIKITPIKVKHSKMDVLGFRIGDFTYITDANYISPPELEKIKGTKVLVLNALRNSKHISHYCLKEAIEIIQHINPQMAYLTHISHFLGLHKDVEEKLPPNIRLAYDELVIKI